MSRPAANAAIAGLVPAHDRVRAHGLIYWVANLAFAISAVVAGI